MSLFCTHRWEVKDKHELPSAAEQVQERGAELECIPMSFFRKKIVWLCQCSKCGAVKTLKESNP